MSWTELEPIVKSVPRAKASISVTKAGAKLSLSFSETFWSEIGRPKAAEILGGHGENAGKLLLKFGAKGKFTFREPPKGGARLTVPIFHGVPDGHREVEPCKVEEGFNKTQAVILLPLALWQAQLTAVQAAARPALPIQPSNGHGNGEDKNPIGRPRKKLDIATYLEGKGHKVARRNDGQFLVDGAILPKARTLAVINEYRSKAQLPPLGYDEVS